MKIRTSIILASLMSLITLLAIFAVPTLRVQENKDFHQKEIPIVIKPLAANLLNVQCEKVFISSPDTLDTFSCDIENRAEMAIRAIGANYSLVADVNGTERADSHLHVADAFVHPDFSREIMPGKSLNISPPGPISIPNGTIVRLELEIVYVQFADDSSVGESSKTVNKIADIRKGASMYKAWLKNEYVSNGRSEDALVMIMDKNSMPASAGNNNFEYKTGEKYYRKFLLERYKTNGPGSIKEVLDQ